MDRTETRQWRSVLDGRAAAEIAAAYSLGSGAVLAGPVARGEQGQVWRLDASGGAFAVKELFMRQTEAGAGADADFQDAVRAAGVSMPRVGRTAGRAVLSELGPDLVRVYEWVDLHRPDVAIDAAAVGRIVAGIHRVRVVVDGAVDPWIIAPVGGERWDELVRRLRGRRAPFAEDLASLRDELVALESFLEAPRDLQLCHCDLWADNLLGTPGGELCVIDWENAGLASPSQELAMVLFEFSGSSPSRARALYGAYLDAGGPGRIDGPGSFSMLIAIQGHITEYDCESWLDLGATDTVRDRHVRPVAELTSRPVTRAVIDRLLSALDD